MSSQRQSPGNGWTGRLCDCLKLAPSLGWLVMSVFAFPAYLVRPPSSSRSQSTCTSWQPIVKLVGLKLPAPVTCARARCSEPQAMGWYTPTILSVLSSALALGFAYEILTYHRRYKYVVAGEYLLGWEKKVRRPRARP